MAEQVEVSVPRPGSHMAPETQEQYVKLLVGIVQSYGITSKKLNDALQEVTSNPRAPISRDLIDIIKELCDCKAVIVILECLCKWMTG